MSEQSYATFETVTTRKRTWLWAIATIAIGIGAAIAATAFIIQGIGPLR